MLVPQWLSAALGITGLLMSVKPALAGQGTTTGASPYHANADACPDRCSVSGHNPGNWSVYPELKKLRYCQETVFYAFSVYDNIDGGSTGHRIHACTSYGSDFPQSSNLAALGAIPAVDAVYEIGWGDEGFGLAVSGIRSLTRQARRYLSHEHGATDKPTIIFAQSGQATIGLYIGQSLESQIIGSSALKMFEDNLSTLNVTSPSLAMQFCGPDLRATHSFGLIVGSNGTFGPLQNAVQSWANGSCLSFSESVNMTSQVSFTKPLEVPLATNKSVTSSKLSTTSKKLSRRHQHLHIRAECKTTRVEAGDSCAKLAQRCGISSSDFTKYNPGSKFCAQLVPKQYVCCSKGDLPDLRPSKNSDGTCHAYRVEESDNCASIAVENGLKIEDLERFNKKTWGWSGCKRLFYKAMICLSEGSPPFPEPIANAQCGPQKPGTKRPSDGGDLSDLNPCPLNACCNIWGQCGITKDFCTDTNTGAPGTAKEGTYGCISNCGTDIVRGGGDGSVRIGYFQGYGLGRDCLLMDVSQIDTSKYTHVHFAFGTLSKNYDVLVGDKLSQYQFQEFENLKNVKRILSFGGWDFSANPATYSIFRDGVKPANRLTMATKIANFITLNGLDGVDIDWEYPGAPDFPDIPPADEGEGKNYLAFLAVLRNLLRGKSLSIAAPSSYWYLKQYPIKDIAKVLDYIVYMTYDLHGQWDTENPHSQEGCDFGNCLRSQVNLTETRYSLAMITKAGVPSSKVIVGVTGFGRSYKMAEAGCYGPDCLYTGNKLESPARKGKCTKTGGYIADGEINEIIKDMSRVTKHYVDQTSHSDILVYDSTEWVSYMSSTTKMARQTLYSAWGMGGTTDWAVDLQEYHDVPQPAKSWAIFKEDVKLGENPREDKARTGNWTDYDCTDPLVVDKRDYSGEQWKLWGLLQTDQAWKDAIRVWKKWDKPKDDYSFSRSVADTLKTDMTPECQMLEESFCETPPKCEAGMNSNLSGPAAQLIWHAFVTLHSIFKAYDRALDKAAISITFSLDHFGNKFAPIPEEEDTKWLFAMIDLFTWGAATAAGPFFNSILKELPYFARNPVTHDNVKDTTMTFIGQSTTLAKDVYTSKDPDWNTEKMDSFANYMGSVVKGWQQNNINTLYWIFNGTDESIPVLWSIISDGKLLEYNSKTALGHDESLQTNIEKAFYGYTIPILWNMTQANAFVLDSGYSCDEEYPVKDYLSLKTMDATNACYNDRLYYLVNVKGDAESCECKPPNTKCDCVSNKFSMPPGLDALNGIDFGGLEVSDLIEGSVRTYNHNGKKNVLAEYDLTSDKDTLEALTRVDITTPGIVRLPVCSPERAFQSWDSAVKGSTAFFPCDVPPGKERCKNSDSSFENETSDKSPLIKDCEAIIRNIEGNGRTQWTVQVVGKNQRKIAAAGTCAFGVEATKVDGNVNFEFGGQDMINLINTAIGKYGKNGKIGAVGDLHCSGNVKQQPVHWAIYHT
ncbi:hypothetical protein LB507_010805 [Fusarium sp. FIESC RH6]|nr:hypothetical protein LB507_010805 [Fusarium sp. FIESC RH6]